MNWKIAKQRGHVTASTIFIDVELEPKEKFSYLVMSDQHWDNPGCDRKLLKSHLNKAKQKGIPVIGNGDFFCAMQGKYDPRSSKTSVRPEHQTGQYLDSLVDTAAEWLEPYKDNIVTLGWGNHESSIKGRQETDLMRRLGEKIPMINTAMGFYVVFNIKQSGRTRKHTAHFFHGSGGGGPVTKGMIKFNRMLSQIDNVDALYMGHIHDASVDMHIKHTINKAGDLIYKPVACVCTPSYKQEFVHKRGSWHVERGASAKPLGSVLNTLVPTHSKTTMELKQRITLITD